MTQHPEFEMRDFLPYLLAQAAEESSLAFAKHYGSRYGMLRTEWRVLFHLGRYGDLTARAICDRAKIHKTKVSRAVSKLEAKRYLSRRTSSDDRRREVLSLTAAGRRVFADLTRFAAAYDAELLARFTREEGEILKRCLSELARLPKV